MSNGSAGKAVGTQMKSAEEYAKEIKALVKRELRPWGIVINISVAGLIPIICNIQDNAANAELDRLKRVNAELAEALKVVLRIADRKHVAFDAAHAALSRHAAATRTGEAGWLI